VIFEKNQIFEKRIRLKTLLKPEIPEIFTGLVFQKTVTIRVEDQKLKAII